MLHYLKEDVLNGYICCECERKKNNTRTITQNNKEKNNATTNKKNSTTEESNLYPAKTSIKFHKYPRILVI